MRRAIARSAAATSRRPVSVSEAVEHRADGLAQSIAAAIRVEGRPGSVARPGDRRSAEIQSQLVESTAPRPRSAQIDRERATSDAQHSTPRRDLRAGGKKCPEMRTLPVHRT